jgi:hypothetical protein
MAGYLSADAVSLTKIAEGKPVLSDSLANEQTVKCPVCGTAYQLRYSDDEWHRLNRWLPLAERAIRRDHKRKQQAASVALEWKPARRKR